MARVRLENVTKRFGSVVAVDHLSFETENGEFLVLLGPSGAGKTTTLRLIAGLDRPDSGAIYLDDRRIDHVPPHLRDVAMTFEEYALYPHLTVYENLAAPLKAPVRSGRFGREAVDSAVRSVAKTLGIEHLLGRRPAELSGGQKQRVSLGRAIIRQPSVFLLDEPLSHLDAKIRHELRAEFHRLAELLRTTIIYVTHDYVEALSLANRVAVIRGGRLEQLAPPRTIYDEPASTFVAVLVGHPEINLLKGDLIETQGGIRLVVTDPVLPGKSRSECLVMSVPQGTAAYALLHSVLAKGQGQVVAGVRPQYIRLVRAGGSAASEAGMPDPTDRAWSTLGVGTVDVFTPLGAVGVAIVNAGATPLRVLTPAEQAVRPGEEVTLSVLLERVNWFDPETHCNLADPLGGRVAGTFAPRGSVTGRHLTAAGRPEITWGAASREDTPRRQPASSGWSRPAPTR